MSTQSITILPRTAANPFSDVGVSRDDRGPARYDGLPESLLAMLRQRVEDSPDAEAVVEMGGLRLSYQALHARAARVAGGLRAAGIAPGDRVALRYPAGADWALAFWGTLMAGAIPVAVNTRFTAPEVAYVLADAGVRMDLVVGTPLPDGTPIVSARPRRGDIAALFYTSGTTGHPKGVPLSHEAFLSNAESEIRCMGLSREIGTDLRTLISVPLYHVTGCNTQLLFAVYLGGTAVIMPALDLPRMIDAITAERISLLITAPAVFALLIAHPKFPGADISTVRWLGYGGAPIAPALVNRLRQAFPGRGLFNGYGLTETAGLLTMLPDADAFEYADSVGFAVPTVDLAIDPFDNPHHGELLVRSPSVTPGYWNRPEDSAAALTDGWFRTGDVVRTDTSGRIYIVDRAKDMINRGGENISSVEVENALLDAPGVTDAAVIGVPDDVMGEKVGAIIVADPLDMDVAAVLEHIRPILADFKIPEFMSVIDGPLPRNPAGKLLKGQLRAEANWGDPIR